MNKNIDKFLKKEAKEIFYREEVLKKNELLKVLDKLDKNLEIRINTIDDKGTYALTGIYKCSKDCPSIHLATGYEESAHHSN
jgi:dGTP triphosphohydrolase